ncbi:MAG: mechanosensitive ion channel, partial [Xanthomonadales bacterium]|nr:mechanosensitive ion channel [Xanthomonadales bacterium]
MEQLLFAVGVLVGGLILSWLAARQIRKRLSKTRLDANAVAVIARTVYYVILVGIFLTFLALLNIPLTALAFLSGAVAIGLGFGAQAIINNLISGWILMTTRPVRIGDFVDVDGSFGVIEDVGNRSTRIRRVDGVHMMVPNSTMLDRTVVNWTLVDRKIRTGVKVGVAYGSDVRLVERLIRQAVEDHESILDDPTPMIYFEDFGDNALLFETLFWCEVGGERELRTIRSDIRFRLDELFRDAGVVIAFP